MTTNEKRWQKFQEWLAGTFGLGSLRTSEGRVLILKAARGSEHDFDSVTAAAIHFGYNL